GHHLDVSADHGQRVALGVGVVLEHGDLHLAVRAHLDRVVHGIGRLVRLVGCRDADEHLGGADRAVTVHHLVPEAIRAAGILEGQVLDPFAVGADHLAQLGHGARDAGEHHRVPVGVDAGGGHGDPHGGAGDRAGGEVVGAGCGVVRVPRDDGDVDQRGAGAAGLVHHLVLHHRLAGGVVVGTEPDPVLVRFGVPLVVGAGGVHDLAEVEVGVGG